MSFIDLQHVKKEFQTKKTVLTAVNDVSLQVDKGDIYGIIGYSGAGKSTLVRLLNGLELPTSGQVSIQNNDLSTLNQRQLREFRKKIGMIFQHFNLLWSRTILQNIQLPLEFSGLPKNQQKAKAQELIQLVGLQGKEEMYPSQLSGGQKQRVGIARALANDPEILLCDEATSALDPQTTDEVLELLLEINQSLGLTIVLITHEMHVIRKICNKVAVMEKGHIIEEGTVLKVFKQPKQEVTKRFVQQELDQEDDIEELISTLLTENSSGEIVALHFDGETANEPVISQAIRAFNIDISILHGKVQKTKEGSFGTLLVLLLGESHEIKQTLEFFKEQQLGVEVFTHE